MSTPAVALLDRPDRLRVALSPIRRQLLERLREPASATELAAEMSAGRQRLNYHLRELEKAGLVHLVEERQRRGCVERILAARADAFVVDPAVMGGRRPLAVSAAAQDRYSAEHLIDAAGSVVRHVARMGAGAPVVGCHL
jgi:DNA-binding transcriptional ArsR family regulator